MINIRSGDVCLVKIQSSHGERQVKALIVEADDKSILCLLVVYIRPEGPSDGIKCLQMTNDPRYIGYSAMNGGNLILMSENNVISLIGSISNNQLSRICCEIFSSNQAWKLERLRFPKPTGVNFWINLNPFVGVHYPGMRRSCQAGETR